MTVEQGGGATKTSKRLCHLGMILQLVTKMQLAAQKTKWKMQNIRCKDIVQKPKFSSQNIIFPAELKKSLKKAPKNCTREKAQSLPKAKKGGTADASHTMRTEAPYWRCKKLFFRHSVGGGLREVSAFEGPLPQFIKLHSNCGLNFSWNRNWLRIYHIKKKWLFRSIGDWHPRTGLSPNSSVASTVSLANPHTFGSCSMVMAWRSTTQNRLSVWVAGSFCRSTHCLMAPR